MWSKRSAVLLALLLVSACATTNTSLVTTWRAPQARPVLSGERVVVLFLGNNATTRRLAEDTMARDLGARGAQATPAYTILDDASARDEAAARARLRDAGFSSLVVMRVAGKESAYRYEPGWWIGLPHYRRLWGGYWGWGWGRISQPGYLVEDRVVSVETLVYGLDTGDLLWAGVSRTVNPDHVQGLVSEVSTEVTHDLEREGLLARSGGPRRS